MNVRGGFLCATAMLVLSAPAFAAAALPDWVLQAASARLPAYPPEIKAVVLLEDKLVTVGADGKAVERYRQAVKILRPQGRAYAQVAAWYSKDSKLNSLHVWSIGPDGHQYTVKPDEVRDIGADEQGMLYMDVRAKVVQPPAADPNAVIAYEWEKQISSYGTEEETWGFQNSIPTSRSVFEVDLPAGWKNYSAWLHHPSIPGTETAPNHWRWELQDIPGIDVEDVPMAPSESALAGRMVLHYSASELPVGDRRWAEIGNWYDNLASSRTEAPQDIALKSREVAAGAADFEARIQDVAEFMQREIRYVAIEIGIGGLQPHAAADVFKNRYGDCKDKATLMIAMLNAVGVRATWVLVDTHRGFIDPALPSIMGNHAIAAIEIPEGYNNPELLSVVTARTGKRYLIFDPTDTYTPIGLLRPGLQGGYGILVAGKESQVILLPKLAPAADLLERTASFDLSSDGTLKGKVVETRTGASAHGLRRIYNEESEKDQRESMEHRLQRDLASFILDSSSIENAHAVSKKLVVDYAFTAASYAKPSGDLLLVRPRVLGQDWIAVNDKPRLYPINMGETGTWRDAFDVALPPGYVIDELPDPVTLDLGFASYHSEVKGDAAGLHYSREYVVRELGLEPEKYADVRKLMGTIAADENSSAVLKKK